MDEESIIQEQKFKDMEEQYALEEQWYLYQESLRKIKETLYEISKEIGVHEFILLTDDVIKTASADMEEKTKHSA